MVEGEKKRKVYIALILLYMERLSRGQNERKVYMGFLGA